MPRLHGVDAERFIERELTEVAVNSTLWEAIFLAASTGEYWLETFPHSERHGGGPLDLELVSPDLVRRKLESEEGWERREVPASPEAD